ncbi:hypothetical protein PMI26_02374, partial [Pseudomonas sp. GM33]
MVKCRPFPRHRPDPMNPEALATLDQHLLTALAGAPA